MNTNLKTSVIGSYPVSVNTTELMNSYFDQHNITWNKYIDEAVHDMITAGITCVSDGQTRDPFIQIFTRKLQGCRIRDRTEIVGKIAYNNPITIDDQKYVKTILPKGKELIGVLTGPYTLMKSCVDQFYHNEQELAFDFASALKTEAQQLEHIVDFISIDEPFFSNNFPEYAHELIKTITKDISCPTRLHVCGDVSSIVPDLLDMPVDILTHEFKASPHLFNAFKEHDSKKKICLGSVRSDDARVETVEEIVAHIQKGIQIFGEKLIQVSPDCGQRLLLREITFKKLQNLVLARRKIDE